VVIGGANMKENTAELIRLIKENPDLPILPMVAYEVVAEDSNSYWGGSWGKANVGKYLVAGERIAYKDDDPDELIEEMTAPEKFEKMTDEEILRAYEELPWIEAIIVHIELPEV
jgi:hypothetical protein